MITPTASMAVGVRSQEDYPDGHTGWLAARLACWLTGGLLPCVLAGLLACWTDWLLTCCLAGLIYRAGYLIKNSPAVRSSSSRTFLKCRKVLPGLAGLLSGWLAGWPATGGSAGRLEVISFRFVSVRSGFGS